MSDVLLELGDSVLAENSDHLILELDEVLPGTQTDMPYVTVEWRPAGGPDSTGTWVDISTYVTVGKVTRGRNYELDHFEASTLNLTLATTTRLFDPEWPAGTYYGQLLPMRQIRVTATWNLVDYPLFTGYVQSWGQTTWQDAVFLTTVTAKDAFLRLEQLKLPSSAWALEVVKDDPDLWLRLGETDTVRITDSSDGGNYGLWDNAQPGPGLVVNDSDGAATFAHSLEERVLVQNPDLITGYPFTVSCMVKIDGSDPAGQKSIFTALPTPPSSDPGFHLFVNAEGATVTPGTVRLQILDSGTGSANIFSTIRIDDDLPHHLAVVCPSSDYTLWEMHVDGVNVTTRAAGTNPSWPGPIPTGFVIGNYTDLLFGDYGFGANFAAGTDSQSVHRGTIDEVCVWNSILGSDRIPAHSAAALEGWDGDDTGARITRFLDVIDWPAAARDIDAGISTLGPARWSAGNSALSVMQAWADTEVGAFFVDTQGRIVWRSRHYPLLDTFATTSQVTFGDAYSGAVCEYVGLDLVRDETLIRNPVAASRQGGVSVTVKDDTLVTTYGDRSWASPTTEDRLDSAVRDRALAFLARYKELGTRLRSMTVAPRRSPADLWPAVLGLELGYRITIERTPLGIDTQISTDQIVERIDHSFTPDNWTTTVVGSPVNPDVDTFLILDDASFGLLDANSLAY